MVQSCFDDRVIVRRHFKACIIHTRRRMCSIVVGTYTLKLMVPLGFRQLEIKARIKSSELRALER